MSSIDPLIGQQLGGFLVQEALGRGGMGRVYKGLDVHLKRPVAIKVIAEQTRASEAYRQRFEREAQAVAGLKHPNIVTVYVFGQHQDLYYLVMEYVDGATLDVILRSYEANRELMPHADALHILETVASALDYAHAREVIHRDVKPSNIMLERDGRPVLTDFGLAMRLSEGTVGDTFGSPRYISPEQARNSANAVPQSDLYSLGVVAYELLTGALPFDDPSPTALAMQHIMAAVPSPRTFNRSLPEAVERVLFRALAKAPQERYPTGAAFVAALAEALTVSPPTPADLPTPGVPPRRLSMQSVQDKVQAESVLRPAGRAAGKTLTGTSGSVAGRVGRGLLPYLVAGGGAIAVLILIAIVLSGLLSTPAPVAILPTETDTPTPTDTALPPTLTPTALAATETLPPPSPPPSPTAMPPTLAATETPTPVPPTPLPTTFIPPTLVPTGTPTVAPPTPLPPTPEPPTSEPPTLPPPTPEPPTPEPPTPEPPTPAMPAMPTIAYPDGLVFTLIWDEQAFYVANTSGQRVASANMAFERLGGAGERYEGRRWSAFYPWNEPRRCLVLRLPRARWRVPSAECPDGYNSEIQAQSREPFWTPAEGSEAFRVLWQGNEVGRCLIADRRCEVRFPRS